MNKLRDEFTQLLQEEEESKQDLLKVFVNWFFPYFLKTSNAMEETQLIIYESEDGKVKTETRMEGELDEESTCKEFLQVKREGKREVKRQQKYYNLDHEERLRKITAKLDSLKERSK